MVVPALDAAGISIVEAEPRMAVLNVAQTSDTEARLSDVPLSADTPSPRYKSIEELGDISR